LLKEGIMFTLRYIATAALAALLALPSLAAAQEPDGPPIPVAEISGGYMLMRDTDANESYPGGWYFSGGVNFTRWFGLVGEAAGSYKKLNETAGLVSFTNRIQQYTFMGGPRVFYKAGRVVPFGQVLVGAGHTRYKGHFDRPLGNVTTFNASETDVALQPGGGVTLYVTDRIGVRLAGDYRWLMDYSDDEWDIQNEFRVMAGMTFGWGAR
jgi:hypothetical protein